ncbi:unnamed protein product [Arctia plantaginis]|uniref:Luciferin 4-monooxygenase n=1 Tax=Arctia plantaginis TaxID=874455 RepID=A0A8S1BAH7_ARCPL|nr:unnamed protein product [Arctia plantaginis]
MSLIVNCFKPRFKNLIFPSCLVRDKSIWTSEKIVNSPYKDIDIPNVTLNDYMFWNLEKWATKTAVVCGVTNRGYTYEQVYKKSRVFGASLKNKFKIKAGDVIAVMLSNGPEYPIITMGILAAGGVVTTMNPIYTPYEVQRQIILSEANVIVTNIDIAPTIKEALKLAKRNIPIIMLDITESRLDGTISYKELVEDHHVDLDILNEVQSNCDDVAILLYSSGTTGLPKGVELTHKNLISNSEQQNTELRQYSYTTASHQDNTLVVLPMFHSFALSVQMIHKMTVGLKLITLPKFQPEVFLNTILMHKIHSMYLAPPVVLFLGSHPQVTAKHFEHVKTITSGAAPLPSADVQRLLHKAGRDVDFCQGYGLTEAGPVVSLPANGQKTYDDVGHCLPNVQMRIVDREMKNVGPDKVGELLVRGPNVMKGYFKNPQATKETFEGDWLRTGDIGKIDKTGLLFISDRLKELIKVNAYQVPPAELENVLKEHPAVLDVAVVGVPDDVTGERPRAFVVLKQGVTSTDKEIMEFINKRVAPYKKIKQVSFLDSIPKNASGKILRKTIKEQYC